MGLAAKLTSSKSHLKGTWKFKVWTKLEKTQFKNHYSMKGYNISEKYQQKVNSPFQIKIYLAKVTIVKQDLLN